MELNLLGLHCTEASPVKGLGHSQTKVRNGRVFATRHSARTPHDVESQGFLHFSCRHARFGPHSASFEHSISSRTKIKIKVRLY